MSVGSTVYPSAAQKQEPAASPTGRNTVTPEGKNGVAAPKNVISTGSGARAVAQRLARGHIKRVYMYERIQGMADGNPPYSPQRMKQAGVNDMTNVNWGDFEAIFNGYMLSFWSLFNDVQYVANFQLRFMDPDTQGQGAFWSQILAEEFDRTIKLWPSFRTHMEFHQSELCKIGMNCIIFPDERDWRFKPIAYVETYAPDRTLNDIEQISCFAVEQSFSVQDLFNFYEKSTENKKGVWNPDALADILLKLANISDDKRGQFMLNGYPDVQRWIRNNEVQYEDLYADQIHFVRLFQKEYDNKVTNILIHRNIATTEVPFMVDRQYESMSQAAIFFSFRPGERFLHSTKGLGKSIFSSLEATTRLDCSLVDQGMRSGSLFIKSAANRGTDARAIKFIHGGVVDLGEADIQQNQLGSNIQGTLAVSQHFTQKVFGNNNISGLNPQQPDADRSTRAVAQQATREARVQKNTISHYYDQLDTLFSEIVRKMLASKPSYPGFEYADMWKKNCIRRGVPKEVFDIMKEDLSPNGLPNHIQVFATRASGSGSQIADQIEVQAMMSILPTLGEGGRDQVLTDYITAFRGFRFVDRYRPASDKSNQPLADDTIASIENNLLKEGDQIVVSPASNQAVHAQSHIRALSQAMQDFNQVQQQVQQVPFEILDQTDKFFGAGGPHLARHLLFLSQDPTRRNLMEQLKPQFSILENFGNMVRNNAQKARQGQINQQQKQQGQMDKVQGELQIKATKAQGELAIKQTESSADIAREMEEAKTRESNRYLTELTRIENAGYIKAREAEGKLAIEAAKAMGQAQLGEKPPGPFETGGVDDQNAVQ